MSIRGMRMGPFPRKDVFKAMLNSNSHSFDLHHPSFRNMMKNLHADAFLF